MKISKMNNAVLTSSLLVTLLFLFACAGRSPQEQTPATELPESPLTKKYHNVLVLDFKTNQTIQNDYPQAADECKNSLVNSLIKKNTFKSVLSGGTSSAGLDTLIIGVTIQDMRIVSDMARFWGGAMAGSSFMNIDLVLIDSATNKEIRRKDIDSSNNAFGAAYSMGASDRSMPDDMGKIIAEYIVKSLP